MRTVIGVPFPVAGLPLDVLTSRIDIQFYGGMKCRAAQGWSPRAAPNSHSPMFHHCEVPLNLADDQISVLDDFTKSAEEAPPLEALAAQSTTNLQQRPGFGWGVLVCRKHGSSC